MSPRRLTAKSKCSLHVRVQCIYVDNVPGQVRHLTSTIAELSLVYKDMGFTPESFRHPSISEHEHVLLLEVA